MTNPLKPLEAGDGKRVSIDEELGDGGSDINAELRDILIKLMEESRLVVISVTVQDLASAGDALIETLAEEALEIIAVVGSVQTGTATSQEFNLEVDGSDANAADVDIPTAGTPVRMVPDTITAIPAGAIIGFKMHQTGANATTGNNVTLYAKRAASSSRVIDGRKETL